MNKKKLWESILDLLRNRNSVNQRSFETWIEPLIPLYYNDGILLLKTESVFGIESLNSRYSYLLEELAKELEPDFVEIRFTLEDTPAIPVIRAPLVSEQDQKTPVKQKLRRPSRFKDLVNPLYCFDRFVSVPENALAINSAYAIAKNPGERPFNPLYIQGTVGVGKTFLLHAIANYVVQHFPSYKVVLTTGEGFAHNCAAALREGQTKLFEETFLSADVLLLDNVHVLSGKSWAQQELFRFFNILHQKKKLIVITAHGSPASLNGIEPRLISRFQWGLAVELSVSQVETRFALLKGLAEREKMDLPENILQYIAENIKGNVRELEGVIINLLAQTSIKRTKIDMDAVEEALRHRSSAQSRGKHTAAEIVAATREYYKIPDALLKGKERSKEVSLCRQVAMYLLRKNTTLALNAIGIELGGRDHSTVIHATKAVEARLATDDAVRNDIVAIERSLRKSSM